MDEETRATPLRAVHFPTPDLGIATGEQGLVLRTIDGGATWSVVDSGDDANWLKSISFPTPEVGYIAGSRAMVFSTHDSGASWSQHPVDGARKLNGVAFMSSQHGIAVGAEGRVFSTSDAGVSWTLLHAVDGNLSNACIAKDGSAWVTSNDASLLRVEWITDEQNGRH